MTNTPLYNLDDVAEYFEFQAKNHVYRFRYMTADEAKKLGELASDEEKTKEYLFSFITKVDGEAPEFREVFSQFNILQNNKFFEMLTNQFGMNAKN